MMHPFWTGSGMVESRNLVLALTTERNLEQAELLARELLERGLVACVSLLPIQSLYVWDGQLQQDPEVQLLLKTSTSHALDLREAVLKLHSYDTPEWITWPAMASQAYGHWLYQAIRSDASSSIPSGQPESGPQAG